MTDFIDPRRNSQHSAFGMVSFIISMLATLPAFPWLVVVLLSFIDPAYSEGLLSVLGFTTLCLMGSTCLTPLGILFGLLSLFEQDKNRLFGIVGLVQGVMILCPVVVFSLLLFMAY